MYYHHTKNDPKSRERVMVWKERGETLSALLLRYRSEEKIPDKTPITYAGRLDPMAEGWVLLLSGNERYKKDEYLRARKTYVVDVLFGIATDTGDVLGEIEEKESEIRITHEKIKEVIEETKNITFLPYPAYSSKTIRGKPLFSYARSGESVSLPQKEVAITQTQLFEIRDETISTLAEEAVAAIARVDGDFRQQEIIEQWKAMIQERGDTAITVATMSFVVSSGTYMRSLAAWIGEKCGIPTLAYRIVRTRIDA